MESIAKDYNTVGYSEFARIVDTPSAPPNIPKVSIQKRKSAEHLLRLMIYFCRSMHIGLLLE